jgi:hypothetical protein
MVIAMFSASIILIHRVITRRIFMLISSSSNLGGKLTTQAVSSSLLVQLYRRIFKYNLAIGHGRLLSIVSYFMVRKLSIILVCSQ